uniref:Uncharacterized protein n=1 Tax=Romanomermis culicivorax TaxID=13658 RepID=A0A915IT93_ROMCU
MFSNKVVVITGSSSGIGAHAAVEFAKQGACVALHGRNRENLMQVQKECLVGGKVEDEKIALVIGDICSESVQDQLIKTAVKKYGKMDILMIGTMGYCVSKTALDGFTRALAAEVAPLGVRPRDFKNLPRAVPMLRYGTTIETSKAILFLASDHSSYTTGNMLMVDGGSFLNKLTPMDIS